MYKKICVHPKNRAGLSGFAWPIGIGPTIRPGLMINISTFKLYEGSIWKAFEIVLKGGTTYR